MPTPPSPPVSPVPTRQDMLTFLQVAPDKTIMMDIPLTETVVNLKARIQLEEGICVVEQVLMFSGQQLEDDRTLQSYNFEAGKTIVVVRQAARSRAANRSRGRRAARLESLRYQLQAATRRTRLLQTQLQLAEERRVELERLVQQLEHVP